MTPIQVLISQPAGHFKITTIEAQLETMQALVGGYIEAVSDPAGANRFTAYCNEEGKLHGFEVNWVSTRLLDVIWLDYADRTFSSMDLVVGPVMWTGGPDGKGDDTGLDQDLIHDFTKCALADAHVRLGVGVPTTVVRTDSDVWVIVGNDAQVDALVTDQSTDKTSTLEVWPSVTPSQRNELLARFVGENGNIRIHQ